MGFLGPELETGRSPPVPERTRGLLAFAVGGRVPDDLRAPDVGVSLLGIRAFCGDCERPPRSSKEGLTCELAGLEGVR
jgi:hypothetical protein